MFEAQLINVQDDANPVIVYSPWFPRGGDYLRVTVEVINISVTTGVCVLETKVFTKDSEDTTNGLDVNAGTAISLNAPGRSTTEWNPSTGTGLNELVRLRFKASVTTDGLQWVLFRVLPLVWFDAVQA